jgi:hypothetical protein
MDAKSPRNKKVVTKTTSQTSIQKTTPTFFLYSRLNENQTKSLRKAHSNRDEKRVLAEIFGLKSILNVAPNESPNKVE